MSHPRGWGGGGGETQFVDWIVMVEKQTDGAAEIGRTKGSSASLFSMPNLVTPQDPRCVEDRMTNISCLTDYGGGPGGL